MERISELLFFSLACYGLCYGWIESPLVEPVREKFKGSELGRYLVTCYHCSGFWVGLVVALIWFGFNLKYLIMGALYSSAFCYSFDKLLRLLEKKLEGGSNV